jgi:hypothetical protein
MLGRQSHLSAVLHGRVQDHIPALTHPRKRIRVAWGEHASPSHQQDWRGAFASHGVGIRPHFAPAFVLLPPPFLRAALFPFVCGSFFLRLDPECLAFAPALSQSPDPILSRPLSLIAQPKLLVQEQQGPVLTVAADWGVSGWCSRP